MPYSIQFSKGQTDYYLKSSFLDLPKIAPLAHAVFLIDSNVYELYKDLFIHHTVLIIDAGEQHKSLSTIHELTLRLLDLNAHKSTFLIGVGGGVVLDITGFLASVFMRGVSFGFVPTTILAMVDASIGGKNGVNIGLNKNMLGTINQPKFILFDTLFLQTLPNCKWSDGFAEVIKYACIGNSALYHQLANNNLVNFQSDSLLLQNIIEQCVQQKNKIVLEDEFEKNLRKTLNFGHTAGHAFETLYHLPHGQAVTFGMIVALIASEQQLSLSKQIRTDFVNVLNKYQLAHLFDFEVRAVLEILKHDKKRNGETIDFILLKSIGDAVIFPLEFDAIQSALQIFADEYKS
jgi:3-dehydroquinate synthase